MERDSLLISSLIMAFFRFLCYFITSLLGPKIHLGCRWVNLLVCTTVMIINFPHTSENASIHFLFTNLTYSQNALSLSYDPLDSETINAVFVFIYSDYIVRLVELINGRCHYCIELVHLILFHYIFINGFFKKYIGFVFFLGIIQNVIAAMKYLSDIRHKCCKIYRFSLILWSSFWLLDISRIIYSIYFGEVLKLHYETRIFTVQRIALLQLTSFSYFIVEAWCNPFVQHRRLIEEEFIMIFQFLKLRIFSFLSKSGVDVFDSNEAKVASNPTARNQNGVMLLETLRCVIALKKKCKKIRNRRNSRGNEEMKNGFKEAAKVMEAVPEFTENMEKFVTNDT